MIGCGVTHKIQNLQHKNIISIVHTVLKFYTKYGIYS